MACHIYDYDCIEDSIDVWVMWLLIICGVIFVVSLTAVLVRCYKDRKKPGGGDHHHPPPSPPSSSVPLARRAPTPVYVVSSVTMPQPQQVVQVTPQQQWSFLPVQEYPPPPPTYEEIQLQNAPPSYDVTYVTTVQSTVL